MPKPGQRFVKTAIDFILETDTLRISLIFLATITLLSSCSTTSNQTSDLPELRFHGFLETLEIAPLLLAVDKHYPHEIDVKRGGIQNLYGVVSAVYGDPGVADIATNAETQLLRYSLDHPELRMIMTISEGNYDLVARRSSGINSLKDFKGKRVGTLPNTSAAYFLEGMLATAGLTLEDITLVTDIDLPEFSDALIDGHIDALAMWAPEPEEAGVALGNDFVNFSGDGVYREIFNLNTTAQALEDPVKREAIKQFMKSLIQANSALLSDPSPAQQLVVDRMAAYPPAYPLELIAEAWPHHTYITGKVDDLLDVMVEEERWMARNQGRQPRSRDTLASLIDYTLLDEILAESGNH